jgi:hypothetical protein
MNGTVRAKLLPDRPYLTAHYTGVDVNYADPNDTPGEMKSVQAWAASAAKGTPWEYNWVLDSQGFVWTYAGEYTAAHSAGENSLAHGVLLLLGNKDDPPPVMIDAFRKLRYELQRDHMIALNHQVRQHGQMPGANTGCPGELVKAKWNSFLVPWTEAPPPPPPPSPNDYIISLDPFGTFVISEQYRWPYGMAKYLYGNGDLWPWISRFNGLKDDLSDWPASGTKIKIPSLGEPITGRNDTAYAGVTLRVPPEAAAAAIIGVVYPNESFAKRNSRVPLQLARWNAGQTEFKPGEIVFVEVKP